MPQHVAQPVAIPAPGAKVLEEFVGHVSTGTGALSVARMTAPPGWSEPAQTPAFAEVTIVLAGTMRVEHADGFVDVRAGETVLCEPGERVRYLNPSDAEPCHYWAVCAPAFSPATVHREDA